MQARQFNELDAARRVATFLAMNPPAPALASMPAPFLQQVQLLTSTIQRIEVQATAQIAAGGAIHDRTAAAREAARELRSGHLVPLKRVARMLVRGSTGDGLSANFAQTIAIPHIHSYPALLTAAAAAVQNIAPHKDLFVARGLPEDFLDQITAQSAVLSDAIHASSVAKSTRCSSTTDLRQLFQELRDTVHVLELGVVKACKGDRVSGPTTWAAWKSARAVRRTPRTTDVPFATPTTE